MLEVCFSDSVKGALRVAQNCGKYAVSAVAVALIGAENLPEKERKREEKRLVRKVRAEAKERKNNAISLGGGREDVLGLSFAFSHGDIAEPLSDFCARKELLRRWMTVNPWGELEQMEESARAYWQSAMSDLARLTERANSEPVRIWADYTPDGLCGLLFAAELLCNTAQEVAVVFPPLWTEATEGLRECIGWGDVHPEYFGKYSERAESLPQEVLRFLAERWRELKKENAPLRAVLGGRVVSVAESFYDDFIRCEIAVGEMTVGKLIGTVLGKYRPGIGDSYLAERIRLMLAAGELCMVCEDTQRFYASVIRKSI